MNKAVDTALIFVEWHEFCKRHPNVAPSDPAQYFLEPCSVIDEADPLILSMLEWMDRYEAGKWVERWHTFLGMAERNTFFNRKFSYQPEITLPWLFSINPLNNTRNIDNGMMNLYKRFTDARAWQEKKRFDDHQHGLNQYLIKIAGEAPRTELIFREDDELKAIYADLRDKLSRLSLSRKGMVNN